MSGAPSPPRYMPTPYTSPGSQSAMAGDPFSGLPSPGSVIPQVLTPGQGMDQAWSQVEQPLTQNLPWLSLAQYNQTGNPSSPGGGGPWSQPLMQQMSNWYMQNQVMPGISQGQAQGEAQGQNYGSYAPAMAGQTLGEGQQQAFQAALSANNQNYQNVLAGRQAYFGQDVPIPFQQNALDVSRGENIYQDMLAQAQGQSGYQLGSAGMQNQFNMSPYVNPNAFNLQNYPNQMARTQYNNQMLGNIIGAPFQIAGAGLGAATGLSQMGLNNSMSDYFRNFNPNQGAQGPFSAPSNLLGLGSGSILGNY